MAERTSENVLADFAHQLRQPLSALEALTCYLDLITKSEDTRVHEQLRRIHFEIGYADQILREGIRTLLAYFQSSSMARQAGAAKRSSSASVVSRDAIVPSKSTSNLHFTRAGDTLREPVDTIAPSWPGGCPGDGLFNRPRQPCQPVSFTFTLTPYLAGPSDR